MLRSKYFWGALSIIAMWAAVLVIGVTGTEDFVVESAAGDVRLPAVWGVALFALIGSWVIAWTAFRDQPEPRKPETSPPPEA